MITRLICWLGGHNWVHYNAASHWTCSCCGTRTLYPFDGRNT